MHFIPLHPFIPSSLPSLPRPCVRPHPLRKRHREREHLHGREAVSRAHSKTTKCENIQPPRIRLSCHRIGRRRRLWGRVLVIRPSPPTTRATGEQTRADSSYAVVVVYAVDAHQAAMSAPQPLMSAPQPLMSAARGAQSVCLLKLPYPAVAYIGEQTGQCVHPVLHCHVQCNPALHENIARKSNAI
ncbi:hypothetical protein DPEC_G00245400 [Dallia pectoralis]|uniref:Uncharacterized protein n=1 Tax=Dallia pectoralis TaxID=75939 RepID=A0ACC2FW16_DALPE|nr:hypothetical protein DPEC_G00245400 [Dallia pectoralis]